MARAVGGRQWKPAAQPPAPVGSQAVREFVALGSRGWEAESQDTVLCVATRVCSYHVYVLWHTHSTHV